jgi:hypothetical protein
MSHQAHNIYSRKGGRKADVLGQTDRRHQGEESTSFSSGDPAVGSRDTGATGQQEPALIAHASRAPSRTPTHRRRGAQAKTEAEAVGWLSWTKANQAQARQRPRHGAQGSRHSRRPLILYFFLFAWLLFSIFFLFPWQLSNNRQGWKFTRSVEHDLNYYQEVLKSLVSSFLPTTSSISETTPPSEEAVSYLEPPVKMATEQTWVPNEANLTFSHGVSN